MAILFTRCNDDFLERQPLDQISKGTFWKSENDLRVYNNNFYDMAADDDDHPVMMGHTNSGWETRRVSIWYLDEYTDNMAATRNRLSHYLQIRAGTFQPEPDARLYGYRGWGLVRSINIGLANYDNADVSEAVKNKYRAEARLFRGWFYADKVSKFGDVHWIGDELNIDSEKLSAPRTPRAVVMDSVLADLTFAAENLPADWNDGLSPGRLNRWAALLVKSRYCLFEGTWRKYHGMENATKWLEESAAAAKELIENGPYSLYVTGDTLNDYNAYHRVLDLSGNPEVIYWRKYDEVINANHVQRYFNNYHGGATKNMVEDYLAVDGLPISLSPLYQGDESIEDVFVNRDPRLRQTILHPDDKLKYRYDRDDQAPYPALPNMDGRESNTGYHVIKIYNADDQVGKPFSTGESPAITLRLGEALLNYAEAKAELGTITQADLDMTINALRDRVGMPHLKLNNVPVDPRYISDGVSPLIVEIRRERRIELFMEGFRYDDLRRWKQGKKLENPDLGLRWTPEAQTRYTGAIVQTTMVDGKEYIDVYKGTDYATPVFDESKHYLWPIPLNEIAQNPQITQNPGWAIE